MCRRALESNGEMRTSRWTPDSVFSQPCALWPLTMMVADLMPASSPSVSSISSTPNFRRSAPAHVHAQQHARPVAAFGAARAGVHFDIAVVAVRLARKQRFELAPVTLGFQRPESGEALRLQSPRRPRPLQARPASLRPRGRAASSPETQAGLPAWCARASPFRRSRDRSRDSDLRILR